MKKILVILTCLGILISFRVAGATIIDFDALAPGTLVNTIEGVTFASSVNAIGLDLVVSTGFNTTSGSNYLGVNDGGFEVFFPGDVVSLSFAVPITSLTVDFISSPVTPGEVFSIDTVSGSSISAAAPASVLLDGGEVYSVSFSSPTPFSSAQLMSFDTGDIYSYNIDTIEFFPVPEPSTLLLLCSGLSSFVIFVRGRGKSS